MQQLKMLLLLVVWLQIYCNSGVLSLPPSLIASAASGLRHQHQARQQQQQRAKEQQQQSGISSSSSAFNTNALWKKDSNANYYDPMAAQGERALETAGIGNDGIKGSSIYNNNNNNLLTKSRIIPPNTLASNRASFGGGVGVEDVPDDPFDIPPSSLLLSSSPISQSQLPTPPVIVPRIREIEWNKFLTPLKYWTKHCQPNVDDNCPQEYQQYQFQQQQQQQQQQQTEPLRIADNRNTAAAALGNIASDNIADSLDYNSDIDTSLYPNKDIFMLLNGQEDLVKFLHWAMDQLQPYERLRNFSIGNGDAIYSTDKHWWKKLNLSGRREPPLFVEEPRYVIVRREPLDEDKLGFRLRDDPFIPPRGRKHQNLAELEQLLNRFEPFVPNRGKRDKIKDIFKYEDLFFPNRGKKQNLVPVAGDVPQDGAAFNIDDVENGIATADANGDNDDVDDDDYEENRNRYDADKWTLPPPPLQQAAPPLGAPVPAVTAAFRPSKFWQQKTAGVDGKPSLVVNINGGRQHTNNKSNNKNNNNNNEDNDNKNLLTDDWPQRMSTNDVKINGYDQSVKTSMPTITTTAKMKTATGEMSTTAATKQQQQHQPQQQQWQPQKQRQYRLRRIINADGVTANRLHATRSMSTMEQQQLQQQEQQQRLLMATAKQWLKSPIGNMPLTGQQLLSKLKQQQQHQHFQHHPQHQQQQQQQHETAAIWQHPLIFRYLQLLQRNAVTKAGGRQSPQETQLAALDMQQQQQQQQQQQKHQQKQKQKQKQLLPTTFIDGNDDYNYF